MLLSCSSGYKHCDSCNMNSAADKSASYCRECDSGYKPMGRKAEDEALQKWAADSSDNRSTPLECKRDAGSMLITLLIAVGLIGLCLYFYIKRKR